MIFGAQALFEFRVDEKSDRIRVVYSSHAISKNTEHSEMRVGEIKGRNPITPKRRLLGHNESKIFSFGQLKLKLIFSFVRN